MRRRAREYDDLYVPRSRADRQRQTAARASRAALARLLHHGAAEISRALRTEASEFCEAHEFCEFLNTVYFFRAWETPRTRLLEGAPPPRRPSMPPGAAKGGLLALTGIFSFYDLLALVVGLIASGDPHGPAGRRHLRAILRRAEARGALLARAVEDVAPGDATVVASVARGHDQGTDRLLMAWRSEAGWWRRLRQCAYTGCRAPFFLDGTAAGANPGSIRARRYCCPHHKARAHKQATKAIRPT